MNKGDAPATGRRWLGKALHKGKCARAEVGDKKETGLRGQAKSARPRARKRWARERGKRVTLDLGRCRAKIKVLTRGACALCCEVDSG